jgi:hypothetical protein
VVVVEVVVVEVVVDEGDTERNRVLVAAARWCVSRGCTCRRRLSARQRLHSSVPARLPWAIPSTARRPLRLAGPPSTSTVTEMATAVSAVV